MRLTRHRLLGALIALVAPVLLGACGSGRHPFDATAENNGYYVKLGGISYQLQISRELNPYSVEDRQYLAGLGGATPPAANQIWYAVFLRAMNATKHNDQTSNSFDIVDTQGVHYYPIRVDPSINQYAWTAQALQPNQYEPGPDSTASFGPTQGGLVLFKLNTTVYNNRPLTLEIRAPGESRSATISLDL